MLAMMAVIVDYTFKMFLTFYILQAGPPNVARPGVTYLFYSFFWRAWVH